MAKTGAAKKRKAESSGGLDLEALQRDRDAARARKDWTTADRIRDQITALGLKVQDKRLKDGGGSVLKNVSAVYEELKHQGKERRLAKKAAQRAQVTPPLQLVPILWAPRLATITWLL